MSNPYKTHLTIVDCILRYIRGTLNRGIFYSFTSFMDLWGYANADWAGSTNTRWLTAGWCMFLGTSLISLTANSRLRSPDLLPKLSTNPCRLQVVGWFGFKTYFINLVILFLVLLSTLMTLADQAHWGWLPFYFLACSFQSHTSLSCIISEPDGQSLHQSFAPSLSWFSYCQIDALSEATSIWWGV